MSAQLDVKAFQARLEALEGEIDRLGDSAADIEGFFRVFLERIISVLGVGGGVWQVSEFGELTCISHMNLAAAALHEQGRQHQLLNSALDKVMQSGAAVVLPGHDSANIYDGGLTAEAGANDSPHTLLFAPIIAADKISAVLVLISPADVDPRAVRGYLGFVLGLCEKAGRYLERNRIEQLQAELARTERLRQYLSALHSSLQPRRTCYALANYGQELLGVYRCLAGTYNSRGKFRMESVSGLESVAVKSSLIKNISAVARQVCRNGKALIVENPEAARSQSPQTDDDLLTAARLYMLQARSVAMGVFPITWQQQVVGALVVEKAHEEPIDQAQRQQIEALLVEAGSALSHALTYRNLPFSPLIRAWAAARDRIYRMNWARRALWTAILAALVLTPFLIRMQVKVYGAAELIPVESRIAYAAQEGIIDSVSIPPDRIVSAGAVLAVLDSRIIDQQIERVTNEIDEVNIALFQEINSNPTGTTAEIYRSEIKAKQAELEQYRQEKNRYRITAPVAGRVITPESVLQQLPSRPVSRGEPILEVVPLDSLWELKVGIPEDEAGELLAAYDNLQSDEFLWAKFILNAYPRLTFQSRVISVARRAHVLSTGPQKYRNVIEVRIAQPPGFRDQIDPRQGLEGKVAVECGRRSLFYAVTHEFSNFIRINLF
ncbi:MAG: hypothetical protein AMJ79_12665 [Phycisphaerae bacterium SM23_30]|nr:MAG: hypothetical protein AMJ79_12665 [Phycisphaerae bacterium SM23_30]